MGGTDKRFKDLYELVANYKEYLITPLDSPLPSQPWYVSLCSIEVLQCVDILGVLFP